MVDSRPGLVGGPLGTARLLRKVAVVLVTARVPPAIPVTVTVNPHSGWG